MDEPPVKRVCREEPETVPMTHAATAAPLIADVLTAEQKQFFHDHGYVIVPNVLTPAQCMDLRRAVASALNYNLLERYGESYRIAVDDPSSFAILADADVRKRVLKNPNIIYIGSENSPTDPVNTRAPRLAKQTGMGPLMNLYDLPEKHAHVTANRTIYNAMRELYALVADQWPQYALCDRAHAHMLLMQPERMGLKVPPGKGRTPAMMNHVDCYFPDQPPPPVGSRKDATLFTDPHGPGQRLQGLVTFWMDQTAGPESGTLEVIPGFHVYWELFGLFTHPETGLEGHRRPLGVVQHPPIPLDAKTLEAFNTYVGIYTELQSEHRWMLARRAEQTSSSAPSSSSSPAVGAANKFITSTCMYGRVWLRTNMHMHARDLLLTSTAPVVPDKARPLQWTTVLPSPSESIHDSGHLFVRWWCIIIVFFVGALSFLTRARRPLLGFFSCRFRFGIVHCRTVMPASLPRPRRRAPVATLITVPRCTSMTFMLRRGAFFLVASHGVMDLSAKTMPSNDLLTSTLPIARTVVNFLWTARIVICA